ncbi:MAG: hypothetical protein JNL82_15390 [Myxococcales bacterium]|nr:hypothetical protein [Myxococcales bacterium]
MTHDKLSSPWRESLSDGASMPIPGGLISTVPPSHEDEDWGGLLLSELLSHCEDRHRNERQRPYNLPGHAVGMAPASTSWVLDWLPKAPDLLVVSSKDSSQSWPPKFEDPFRAIEEKILAAVGLPDPHEIVKNLDSILGEIARLDDLGEVKLRLWIKRATQLPSAPPPTWLVSELNSLAEEKATDKLGPVSKELLDVCKRLVCSMLASLDPSQPNQHPVAKLHRFPGGAVEVVWNTRRSLRWLVKESRLPWPGINVRSYLHNPEWKTAGGKSGIVKIERFRSAERLLAMSKPVLEEVG